MFQGVGGGGMVCRGVWYVWCGICVICVSGVWCVQVYVVCDVLCGGGICDVCGVCDVV